MELLRGPEYAPRSGKTPKQLVIFLHGLGANGDDLIGLADEFADALPDAHFLSPDAPFPCDMAPYGKQWFSLQEWTETSMLAGLLRVEPILNHYIDTQLTRFSLTSDALALVGFSQGTMTALHCMVRRADACGGIVGYSGALVGAVALPEAVKSRSPVCLIHGSMDMVVPYVALSMAGNALHAAGIPVETHTRPGLGHGIDAQGIRIAQAFLQKIWYPAT